MLSQRTLHNEKLIRHGIKAATTVTTCRKLLHIRLATVPWSWPQWCTHLQVLHILLCIRGEVKRKLTKNQRRIIIQRFTYSLQWICFWVGSTHKSAIQGLQTRSHAAPVPSNAGLLSTWRGRGLILNTWSNCGLPPPPTPPQKNETRWALCISSDSEVIMFWSIPHQALLFWGETYALIAPERLSNLSVVHMPTLEYMFTTDSVFFARWMPRGLNQAT